MWWVLTFHNYMALQWESQQEGASELPEEAVELWQGDEEGRHPIGIVAIT